MNQTYSKDSDTGLILPDNYLSSKLCAESKNSECRNAPVDAESKKTRTISVWAMWLINFLPLAVALALLPLIKKIPFVEQLFESASTTHNIWGFPVF